MLGMLSVNESGSTATAFHLVARGLGRSSPARFQLLECGFVVHLGKNPKDCNQSSTKKIVRNHDWIDGIYTYQPKFSYHIFMSYIHTVMYSVWILDWISLNHRRGLLRKDLTRQPRHLQGSRRRRPVGVGSHIQINLGLPSPH